MKRLIIALVLIAAGVAGLGWYLGWFNVTVDREKIRADEKKASDRVIGP
jgi:uncharacterized alpha/beta hydrolase family protein